MTILVHFFLDLAADILNLGMLKNRVPEGFEDVYEASRYEKSQEYLRVNTRFGWIMQTVDLLILLVFWFGGGFEILDRWTRSHGYVV